MSSEITLRGSLRLLVVKASSWVARSHHELPRRSRDFTVSYTRCAEEEHRPGNESGLGKEGGGGGRVEAKKKETRHTQQPLFLKAFLERCPQTGWPERKVLQNPRLTFSYPETRIEVTYLSLCLGPLTGPPGLRQPPTPAPARGAQAGGGGRLVSPVLVPSPVHPCATCAFVILRRGLLQCAR